MTFVHSLWGVRGNHLGCPQGNEDEVPCDAEACRHKSPDHARDSIKITFGCKEEKNKAQKNINSYAKIRGRQVMALLAKEGVNMSQTKRKSKKAPDTWTADPQKEGPSSKEPTKLNISS